MQAAFLDDVLELESAAVAQLAEGDAQQADGDELSFLRPRLPGSCTTGGKGSQRKSEREKARKRERESEREGERGRKKAREREREGEREQERGRENHTWWTGVNGCRTCSGLVSAPPFACANRIATDQNG